MTTLMLALQAAAAFTSAEPIHPERWFKADDYPASAMVANGQGTQRMAVTIAPDGSPTACTAIMASGYDMVREVGCRNIMKRGKFIPATENGHPAWGVLTHGVSFFLPDMKEGLRSPFYDVIVPVSQLPNKGTPQAVEVQQLVNDRGQVEACTVIKPSAAGALNKLACNATITGLPIDIVIDQDKKPVRAVVKQTILFAVAHPSP